MTDLQAKRIGIDRAQQIETLAILVPAAKELIEMGYPMFLVRRKDGHHIGPLKSIRTTREPYPRLVVVGLIDYWGHPKEEMFYFPEYRLNCGEHDRFTSQDYCDNAGKAVGRGKR